MYDFFERSLYLYKEEVTHSNGAQVCTRPRLAQVVITY